MLSRTGLLTTETRERGHGPGPGPAVLCDLEQKIDFSVLHLFLP